MPASATKYFVSSGAPQLKPHQSTDSDSEQTNTKTITTTAVTGNLNLTKETVVTLPDQGNAKLLSLWALMFSILTEVYNL